METLELFESEGQINNVLNQFAYFLFNRKSLSESTEKRFVKKLESLQGATNTPASLIQQRISDGRVNYKVLNEAISIGLINEMLYTIKKHSNTNIY